MTEKLFIINSLNKSIIRMSSISRSRELKILFSQFVFLSPPSADINILFSI